MPSLSERARRLAGRKRPSSLETVIDQVSGNGDAEHVEEADFKEIKAEEPEGETERREIDAALISLDRERETQLKPYSDGLPFDLERIKNRVLDSGANILDGMVTVGKYLIWVKEEIGHGEFVAWLDNELGMTKQRAWEFMRVAYRLIESKSPLGRTFLLRAAGSNKKKLLALLDVRDDEIEQAMEMGTFLGKGMDEIQSMSYRQIQDALRKEQDNNIEILQEKADLERKLREFKVKVQKQKISDKPKDEPAFNILDRQFVTAIQALGIMEEIAIEFAEEMGDEALVEPETRSIIASYVTTLSQKVTSISTALIPDQIAGERHHIQHQPTPDPDAQPEQPA